MGIGPMLICGFGPFPAAPANPTAEVVARLRDQAWAPSDAGAAYAVLPTEWDAGPQAALRSLEDSGAGAVLLTGVAVSAEGFRLELVARNHSDVLARDAAGAYCPAPAIQADGPPTRPVTAPAEAMLEALRGHSFPAAVSTDAGAYLCNHVLYALLAATEVPVGFLHVPQAVECVPHAGFILNELEAAVKVAAEAFAASLEPSRS
jgi:pyroglutamyl-peptidase